MADSGASNDLWTYVAAGGAIFCGVHSNGRAECWGDEPAPLDDTGAAFRDWGQFDVPDVKFRTISVQRGRHPDRNVEVCGVDLSSAARCWGKSTLEPLEHMSNVLVEMEYICGIIEGGGVACVAGPDWFQPEMKADAVQLALSSYVYATLGDTGDLVVTFEGPHTDWLAASYPGPYAMVDVVWPYFIVCAIRPDGRIECWNPTEEESDAAVFGSVPEGAYSTLCLTEDDHACALDESGYPVCWGDGPMGEPAEALAQLSCGESDACGVTLDGRILCWGACDHGECEVPE